MRYIVTIMTLLLFAGCGNASSTGVKDAKGETPVKYVICGLGETHCFVAARFKDLDGCESHKRWADMLCDSTSNSGKMVCSANDASQAVAYCVP